MCLSRCGLLLQYLPDCLLKMFACVASTFVAAHPCGIGNIVKAQVLPAGWFLASLSVGCSMHTCLLRLAYNVNPVSAAWLCSLRNTAVLICDNLASLMELQSRLAAVACSVY